MYSWLKVLQQGLKVFKRNISVISDDTNPHVYVYPDALEQLLRIFLDNAYKYSEKDIDVTIKKDTGKITIAIQDYGIGIPNDELDDILRGFIVSIRQELVRAGVPA